MTGSHALLLNEAEEQAHPSGLPEMRLYIKRQIEAITDHADEATQGWAGPHPDTGTSAAATVA